MPRNPFKTELSRQELEKVQGNLKTLFKPNLLCREEGVRSKDKANQKSGNGVAD